MSLLKAGCFIYPSVWHGRLLRLASFLGNDAYWERASSCWIKMPTLGYFFPWRPAHAKNERENITNRNVSSHPSPPHTQTHTEAQCNPCFIICGSNRSRLEWNEGEQSKVNGAPFLFLWKTSNVKMFWSICFNNCLENKRLCNLLVTNSFSF